ncbi:hypothetical protein RGUI_0385 [Rhodovulum sp. P5]|uniref:VPLPA-CTERM sorting domain-containing protein n=1 Tax=Rhodovulum sp. P5 TaxID=1564506 RepID=UPI0009C1F6D1|nr:VPLPA-CTERM sorting domain-containing protein [Rhodovulum sp. P5]ARE38526.1 hypothetical protein RGUI_0385 [Rhodovulum sp. P5]
MRKDFRFRLVAAAAFAALAVPSSADVLYNPMSGNALGITDFSFDGSVYDVHFVGGSYLDIYGGGDPHFLGNETDADAAADAIMSVLNAEPTTPEISDGTSEVLWLVHTVTIDRFYAEQVGHDTSDAPWMRFADFSGELDFDHSVSPYNWLFAKFEAPGTLTAPTVPVPASGLLLVCGVAGMARLASRKGK